MGKKSCLKFLDIICLNHKTFLKYFCCLKKYSNQITKTRWIYFIHFMINTFFLFLFKIAGDFIFIPFKGLFDCNEKIRNNTCFNISIITRYTFTMALYHFFLILVNLIGFKNGENYFNKSLWNLKIVIFICFFFSIANFPNWFVFYFGVFAKYTSILFLIFKYKFFYDFLFFDLKCKFTHIIVFSSYKKKICLVITVIIIYILSFGFFIFNFAYYSKICNVYWINNLVLLIFLILNCLIEFLRFKIKDLLFSSVFTFFISIINFNIFSSTPYKDCWNIESHPENFSKFNKYLNIIIECFIIIYILIFLIKRKRAEVSDSFQFLGKFIYFRLLPSRPLKNYNEKIPEKSIFESNLERQWEIELVEKDELNNKSKSSIKFKVKKNNFQAFYYQFILFLISVYYTMIFTSWVTIVDHSYLEDIQQDKSTFLIKTISWNFSMFLIFLYNILFFCYNKKFNRY